MTNLFHTHRMPLDLDVSTSAIAPAMAYEPGAMPRWIGGSPRTVGAALNTDDIDVLAARCVR